MDFLSVLGLLIIAYCLVYLVLLIIDCDLKLKFSEQYGKSIDTLSGKVVWVTGASSGIGKHLAIVLASHNVRLVLSARREQELDHVKLLCLEVGKNLTSHDILVLPLDVTQMDTHADRFQDVINHFGSLDILVNNAGRSQRADWEDICIDVDKEMFNLNVFSVISLSRIAVKYFLERGEGHLAVTSSLAGVVGSPFSGSYTGSKWAIHGYLNSLRAEKMATDLKISILCPGPTFTNFLEESFTSNVGEKYGKPVSASDRRMTAERCAELCAIALANQLDEVWMAVFPILPICYLMVYFPNLSKMIFKRVGTKKLHKLRDTDSK